MKQELNTIKAILAEIKERLGNKPLNNEEKLRLASILRDIASELEKPA